jgi:hypothetical protein
MMRSRKEKWFSNISPQMIRQADILVKLLFKMKEFAYTRNKLELVETTSLLKKDS